MYNVNVIYWKMDWFILGSRRLDLELAWVGVRLVRIARQQQWLLAWFPYWLRLLHNAAVVGVG